MVGLPRLDCDVGFSFFPDVAMFGCLRFMSYPQLCEDACFLCVPTFRKLLIKPFSLSLSEQTEEFQSAWARWPAI